MAASNLILQVAYDLVSVCVALLVLIAFDPPKSALGWARLVTGAAGAGMGAGQLASHLGYGRTARNLMVGCTAFFADGIIALLLRIREMARNNPAGFIGLLIKLRGGAISASDLKGSEQSKSKGNKKSDAN